jgi:PEGA domain
VFGRLEKVMSQKSSMQIGRESESRGVPTKCPNKSGEPRAEGIEGRRLTKENTERTPASQTPSWINASNSLLGVREVARKEKRIRYISDEHFTVDGTLIEAWASQKSFRPKDGTGRPSEAEIYVDGKFVGQTPATIPLITGAHRGVVKSNGGKDWERELTVLKESQVALRAVLESP